MEVNLTLTKREWLAGLALQGFLAGGGAAIDPERAARDVLDYVDALLEALAARGLDRE